MPVMPSRNLVRDQGQRDQAQSLARRIGGPARQAAPDERTGQAQAQRVERSLGGPRRQNPLERPAADAAAVAAARDRQEREERRQRQGGPRSRALGEKPAELEAPTAYDADTIMDVPEGAVLLSDETTSHEGGGATRRYEYDTDGDGVADVSIVVWTGERNVYGGGPDSRLEVLEVQRHENGVLVATATTEWVKGKTAADGTTTVKNHTHAGGQGADNVVVTEGQTKTWYEKQEDGTMKAVKRTHPDQTWNLHPDTGDLIMSAGKRVTGDGTEITVLDHDGDGSPDEWRYSTKRGDGQEINVWEYDRNGDGKPDEYYEKALLPGAPDDPNYVLEKRYKDTDGDGEYDVMIVRNQYGVTEYKKGEDTFPDPDDLPEGATAERGSSHTDVDGVTETRYKVTTKDADGNDVVHTYVYKDTNGDGKYDSVTVTDENGQSVIHTRPGFKAESRVKAGQVWAKHPKTGELIMVSGVRRNYETGQEITVSDINNDGIPDLWEWDDTFTDDDGNEIKRRVNQWDWDGDGKPDEIQFFYKNANGENIIRSHKDTDGDGEYDQITVNDRQGQTVYKKGEAGYEAASRLKAGQVWAINPKTGKLVMVSGLRELAHGEMMTVRDLSQGTGR